MAYDTQRETSSTYSWSKVFQKEVELLFLHCVYTSDANAGNRQILFQLLNPAGNVVLDTHAGAVQAESNVYHYEMMPGIYRETAFIDESIQVPIPAGMVIPAGYTLKVFDDNTVAVGDSMVVSYQTKEV